MNCAGSKEAKGRACPEALHGLEVLKPKYTEASTGQTPPSASLTPLAALHYHPVPQMRSVRLRVKVTNDEGHKT